MGADNNNKFLPLPQNPSTSVLIAPNKHCNNCPHLIKVEKPNKSTYTAKCAIAERIIDDSYRIIKINVYPDEKIVKPWWCSKNEETKYSSNWDSAKEEWKIKEKWLAMHGLTAWGDIKEGHIYHVPPFYKRKRLDIKVERVFPNSIKGINVANRTNVWLYKDDEEYKFMSLVK